MSLYSTIALKIQISNDVFKIKNFHGVYPNDTKTQKNLFKCFPLGIYMMPFSIFHLSTYQILPCFDVFPNFSTKGNTNSIDIKNYLSNFNKATRAPKTPFSPQIQINDNISFFPFRKNIRNELNLAPYQNVDLPAPNTNTVIIDDNDDDNDDNNSIEMENINEPVRNTQTSNFIDAYDSPIPGTSGTQSKKPSTIPRIEDDDDDDNMDISSEEDLPINSEQAHVSALSQLAKTKYK